MFCKHCGAQQGDNMQYCTNCGQLLEQPQPAVQPAVQPQPVPVTPQYAPTSYNIPPEYAPLSPWAYFGLSILFALPIGFIFLIIFSFNNSNLNRRNFARSYWCGALIVAIVVVLVLIVAVLSGASSNSYYY